MRSHILLILGLLNCSGCLSLKDGLQGFPSNQGADDVYTISIDDSSEVGSGESEDDEYYVQNIITKQETTPKKKVETTTPPVETDATSVTAGLDSSVLEEIRLLLANQKKALADVQSQVAIMSSRLDEQQISINQQDQLLAEHSNSIGELKGRQDRATSDIYTLQSAIVSHSRDKDQHLPSTTEYEATTTPTTSTTTTSTTTTTAASWSTSAVEVEAAGPVQSLTSELHKVEGRVTELEELHTTLSSVLQHIILEKVWLNATSTPQQKSSSEPGLDLQDIKENVTYFSEADVQEVEERTNQVITSIEKWNKVEQTLHASLSNLHATHRSYSQELSQLTNYTLNNGVIIGRLGEARLRDGVSILSLINSTSWLGQRLSQLKSAMNVNQNTTEETNRQIEAQISQLLELIQLNSLKVIAMQDALKGQGSLFESQLNHTIQELHSLERSLSSIDLSVNSSLTHLTGRVQINKERSDMLWSRLRIIDNRLAHVEVKYLTQEVNKYQKSNDDLKQSIKLMEMEDQLEVIESNINTQQSNHEALNSRLNSVADLVNSLTSSMSTGQDKWTEFSSRLPNLEYMYDEVQLMIKVLPRDCDDVYRRGIRSSGVQLIKPGPAHSAVEVYCDIDIESGRGWSVLQQRHSGELDFNKNWTEYREGFGEVRVDKEFWVGNELIHTLTSQYNYTVRFDMWAVNGSYIFAEYTNFKLLSESEGYKLLVSGYSGNATDSLRHSNDMSFSTYEVDNDRSSTHCALFYTAGWWYKHCQYCNLNGRYTVGVIWFNHVSDEWVELSRTKIKISRNSP